MKDLRGLLGRLGYENVQTYIQSGNCVFQAENADADLVSSAIEAAIHDVFGFKSDVSVLSKADLDEAIAANPFKQGVEDPKAVHLFFLAEAAVNADLPALDAMRKETERFHLTDKVFYLYAPEGIGRSKLAAQAERKLGVAATARNLRSATKIAQLAG